MTDRQWNEIDLSGSPRLLLARRKSSKRVEAYRVELHEDLFDDLRSVARTAIHKLERREAKPYSAFAAKSGDDYFDVDTSDIPQRRDRRKREEDPAAFEIASALAMIATTDRHHTLTAEELRTLEPSLYAIVFEDGGEYIGFIRNRSPQRALKPGLRWFQYGDTLVEVTPPDLAIDEEVDVVVSPNRCAVLTPGAFESIFGDVGIVFQQVPTNVETISTALKATMPLTDESTKALTARCGRRVIDAKRLNHIATERKEALARMTQNHMRKLLKERNLDGALRKGRLRLTEENVSEFLDLVEGRLFSDDVTGEERRADAYSPRQS